MSKPLELTIYSSEQECTCCGPIYTMPDGEIVKAYQAENMARQKRLTDAELAAELFRQTSWLGAIGRTYATGEGRSILIEAAFTFGPITRDEYEWLTLSNFATLPHYDEAPA